MKSLKDALYDLNTRLLYLELATKSLRDFAYDLTEVKDKKDTSYLFNMLAKAESMIGVGDLIVREMGNVRDEVFRLEQESGKSKTA